MSATPRRILYLLVEGLPAAQEPVVQEPAENVEVLRLTEATARAALEKIFAADAVSVWGRVE